MDIQDTAVAVTIVLASVGALALGAWSEGVIFSDNTNAQATSVSNGEPVRPFARPESADDRLERLWPQAAAGHKSMRLPTIQIRINKMLIAQTRHKGHTGIYGSRPEHYRPVSIVLHATGSGAPGTEFDRLSQLQRFFSNNGVAASNYAIDRNGNVGQFVEDANAAYHVARPGWNGISIGIELLNDNSGTQQYSDAQLESARQLVRYLGKTYGIPVEAVVRHRDIQPEDRSDPSDNFPWQWFRSTL